MENHTQGRWFKVLYTFICVCRFNVIFTPQSWFKTTCVYNAGAVDVQLTVICFSVK